MVLDWVLVQLTINGIFEKLQSCYGANHSTKSALLKVVNNLRIIVDANSVAVLLFLLDLCAANTIF